MRLQWQGLHFFILVVQNNDIMKNRLTIDNFDGGIGTSTRTNPSNSFSFVKGDVSKDPTTIYPSKTLEIKNSETELGIKSIGYVDTYETICGVGKGMSNWLSKNATKRVSIENRQFTGENRFPYSAISTMWTLGAGTTLTTASFPSLGSNTALSISGVNASATNPYGFYLGTRKVVFYYNVSAMASGTSFSFVIGNGSALYTKNTGLWSSLTNMSVVDTAYSGNYRKAVFTYTGTAITSTSNFTTRIYSSSGITIGTVEFALQFTSDDTDDYIPTFGAPTSSNTMGESDFYWYDISSVDSAFWDLIDSTGSNVAPADINNDVVVNWKWLYFDQSTSSGVIITDTNISYLYLFEDYNKGDTAIIDFSSEISSFFRYDNNITDDFNNILTPFSGTPSYSTITYGQALTNSSLYWNTGITFWDTEEGYIAFDFVLTSGSIQITDSNSVAGGFKLQVTALGGTYEELGIYLYIDGTSASIGNTYASPTKHGSVYGYSNKYRLSVSYNSGLTQIYINDYLLYSTTTAYGALDVAQRLYIDVPSTGKIDNLIFSSESDPTGEKLQNAYYMLADIDYWTYGSIEDTSDVTKTYGGVQLYYYDVTNDEWEDYFNNEFIVKKYNYFPKYGTIFDSSSYVYFPVDKTGTGVINYYAMFDSNLGEVTWNKTSIVSGFESLKLKSEKLGFTSSEVVVATGSSNKAIDSFTGDTVVTADYGAGFTIDAMTLSRRYVVVAGDNENFSYATDTTDTLTTTFNSYNIGMGNIKLLHAPFGIMLGVIDGFINRPEVTSSPFLSIRLIGSDSIDVVSLPVSTNTEARIMEYNGAISPAKGLSKNGMIFWGDLTFGGERHKGLYHVSINQVTQRPSLTYLTDMTIEPVEMANIGDNLYILDVLGNVRGYSSTYDNVEIHTNFIGVDRGNVKNVSTIQCSTSETSDVTAYSRILGGAWVQQGETSSNIRHEIAVQVEEHGEAQYKIVSTEPITGINIVYSQSNND